MSLKAEIVGAKRAVKRSLKTDKPEVIEPRYFTKTEADALNQAAGSKKQPRTASTRAARNWFYGEVAEIPSGSKSMASYAQEVVHTWEVCPAPKGKPQQAVRQQGAVMAGQKSEGS